MKTSVKVTLVLIIGIVAAWTYCWPFIKMNFAGSAQYTEQDSRQYEFYTPELFKNMPRITDHYDFNYANVAGPEALIYAVTFYGTDDTRHVNDYLTAMGYQPQPTCMVVAECWRTTGSKDVVMVAQLSEPERVFIQIYSSPYTR
ncbi:hypothetical protein ACWA06_01315 [Serratia rhizosphaerae]|uniref:hypothetical protein n=1 Tax=unclassified Serratia (in: enterobacteria) TaxID=2647522 RepID=UPI000CF706C1|nr:MULTISPECIES: hypothetical protein [unclassified Serratia (in: enterobacteria)]MCA4822342.1 hypothetical protein [Serratia rubidaea]AVJ17834.1 hypothetical protein CLM71_12170 [Serratia sp. MYb239]QNK34630.1 hypothetical protein HF675_11625 [Serratia sp. JUb9]CAE1146321.1 conserved protein of unknown function [Serratia sp. Tan611]SQJ19216.1 Uncharacterised protein [Serratia rubidaea]